MADSSVCLDKEDDEGGEEQHKEKEKEKDNEDDEKNTRIKCSLENEQSQMESNKREEPLPEPVAVRKLASILEMTAREYDFTGDVGSASDRDKRRCLRICQAWNELKLLDVDLQQYKEYVRMMFRNTLIYTMSWEWDMLPLCFKQRLQLALSDIPFLLCQTLSCLLPDPWGQFSIRTMFCCDPQNGSIDTKYPLPLDHCCISACYSEPRYVTRSRVELLCAASCEEEALQLCLMCNMCPILKGDYFFMETAFRILYCMGNISRMTKNMSKLACHDGFQLIEHILRNEGPLSYSLVECLIQILLVRDLVGPSSYCCTLSLMNLWCSLHIRQQTSLTDISQEAHKLGALASTSAHLYLFVDVLYKQYGRRLLALYLHLYVHALTLDLNNLEFSRLLNCNVAVTEMETHLAAMYTKLGSLLDTEGDSGLTRECVLTAFSLEPTVDRLTRIRIWASLHHYVGPPRLIPCSGECHCTEKGLCRKQLPPRYNTHHPNKILDSTIEGVTHQLLQDLSIVVEGPRCKWLTWNQPWDVLNELCDRYLESSKDLDVCGSALGLCIESRLVRMPTLEPEQDVSTLEMNRTVAVAMKDEPENVFEDSRVNAMNEAEDQRKEEEEEEGAVVKGNLPEEEVCCDTNSPGVCPTAALLTSQMSQAMEFVSFCPRSPSRSVSAFQATDVLNSLASGGESYEEQQSNVLARGTCQQPIDAVAADVSVPREASEATDINMDPSFFTRVSRSTVDVCSASSVSNATSARLKTIPPKVNSNLQHYSSLLDSKEHFAKLAAAECLLREQVHLQTVCPSENPVEHMDSSVTLQSLLESISMMPMDSPQELIESTSACEGIELLANSALLMTNNTSYADILAGVSDSLTATQSVISTVACKVQNNYKTMSSKARLQEGLQFFNSDSQVLDPLLSSVAPSASAEDGLELTAVSDELDTVSLLPNKIKPSCTTTNGGKGYLSVVQVSGMGEDQYDISQENKDCGLLADNFQNASAPPLDAYSTGDTRRRNSFARNDEGPFQKKPTSLSELVQSVIFCDNSSDCGMSSSCNVYEQNNGSSVLCDSTSRFGVGVGFTGTDSYESSGNNVLSSSANLDRTGSSGRSLPSNMLFPSFSSSSLASTSEAANVSNRQDITDLYGGQLVTSELTHPTTTLTFSPASIVRQSTEVQASTVMSMPNFDLGMNSIQSLTSAVPSIAGLSEIGGSPLFVTMNAEQTSLRPQSYILTISPPVSNAETGTINTCNVHLNGQTFNSVSVTNTNAPLSVASVTIPPQSGNNVIVTTQNGTVPTKCLSQLQVGSTHYQIDPSTAANVRQLGALANYGTDDSNTSLAETGPSIVVSSLPNVSTAPVPVKYFVQNIHTDSLPETMQVPITSNGQLYSTITNIPRTISSSRGRCDILAEATAKALGHQHVVSTDELTNVLVTAEAQLESARSFLTVSSSRPSSSGRRRGRGSLFSNRRDRCKWMSIINPHGKMGYRKVGVEKANPTAARTAVAVVPSVTSNVAPRVSSLLSFTTQTSSTFITTETKPFVTSANLNRSSPMVTSITSQSVKPITPIPIVKKCYSPSVFATSVARVSNTVSVSNVPKVFTVSAPTLSQLKNMPRKVTVKKKETVCMKSALRVDPLTFPTSGSFVPITKSLLTTGLGSAEAVSKKLVTTMSAGTMTNTSAFKPKVVSTTLEVSASSSLADVSVRHVTSSSSPAIVSTSCVSQSLKNIVKCSHGGSDSVMVSSRTNISQNGGGCIASLGIVSSVPTTDATCTATSVVSSLERLSPDVSTNSVIVPHDSRTVSQDQKSSVTVFARSSSGSIISECVENVSSSLTTGLLVATNALHYENSKAVSTTNVLSSVVPDSRCSVTVTDSSSVKLDYSSSTDNFVVAVPSISFSESVSASIPDVPLSPAILEKAKTSMMQPKVVLEHCPVTDIIASRLARKRTAVNTDSKPRRKHSQHERAVCPVCTRTLSTNHNLKRHLQLIHDIFSPSSKLTDMNEVLKVNGIDVGLETMKQPLTELSTMEVPKTMENTEAAFSSLSPRQSSEKSVEDSDEGSEFCLEENSSLLHCNVNGDEKVGFLQIETECGYEKPLLHTQADFGKLGCEMKDDVESELEDQHDPLYVDDELMKTADESEYEEEHCLSTKMEPEIEPCLTTARGRSSTRTVKLPSKRGCPCCENDSPNWTTKRCRGDRKKRKSRRGGTHAQTFYCMRQTRGSTRGRNVNA